MDTMITEDGNAVGVGSRVLNYYDFQWGIIARIGEDGWADVNQDNGRRVSLDGSRMAVRWPSWAADKAEAIVLPLMALCAPASLACSSGSNVLTLVPN